MESQLKPDNEQKIDQAGAILGSSTSIFEICQSGNTEDLRIWIGNNTCVNINQKDKHGYTPLHHASGKGHLEMVKLLIDERANIHEKNRFGSTPLYHASEKGHVEVVKLLIDKGASVNETDKFGFTPLHYAAITRKVEVSKILIDKGSIFRDTQPGLIYPPIKEYILEYRKHLKAISLHRIKIFSLFGQFSLSSYATIKPPNIGFVNLMRTCKYPAYYWAINSEFFSEMICLVLCYLSAIPSPFMVNKREEESSIKWRNMQEIFGMEMLMEITYRHLMHIRKIKRREINNIRSLYDSEFATTAIEEVYGKRICNILYEEK